VKRLLAACVCWLSFCAWAHKPSDAYLFITVQGEIIEARWDTALRDLDAALDLDTNGDRDLTWGEVKQHLPAVERLMKQGLQMTRGAQQCVLPWGSFATEQRADGTYLVATTATRCADAQLPLALRYSLFADVDVTHRGILSARIDAVPLQAVLNPTATAPVLLNAQQAGFWSFMRDGMHHILIGWDHILFLICLLLPCVLRREEGRWQAATRFTPVLSHIALTVTAFTVAHSITLALAAFNVLTPPPRQIEALIALTVMFAALNNIVPLVRERIALMAFGFGLIHGFGFANVLAELALPRERFATALFGFNLGVEIGQLLVVCTALLVLYPLRSTRFYSPAVLKGGSAAAFALASIWLAERVFDLSIIST
jgi:hypothetical protein